jgi:hypothetical protein
MDTSGTQIDSWEKIVMHRYNSGLLHPYIEYYYIPSLIYIIHSMLLRSELVNTVNMIKICCSTRNQICVERSIEA